MPEPFQGVVIRRVSRDWMVSFQGHRCPVPFGSVDRRVEVPGRPEVVQILAAHQVMTAAPLDRLLHRCHVRNIKGRSYRPKELERLIPWGRPIIQATHP